MTTNGTKYTSQKTRKMGNTDPHHKIDKPNNLKVFVRNKKKDGPHLRLVSYLMRETKRNNDC